MGTHLTDFLALTYHLCHAFCQSLTPLSLHSLSSPYHFSCSPYLLPTTSTLLPAYSISSTQRPSYMPGYPAVVCTYSLSNTQY